jgi:hypothetical protein
MKPRKYAVNIHWLIDFVRGCNATGQATTSRLFRTGGNEKVSKKVVSGCDVDTDHPK